MSDDKPLLTWKQAVFLLFYVLLVAFGGFVLIEGIQEVLYLWLNN